MKSGFIAVLGVPNVGKSTLVNRLCGRKVAGTSPKPQTTRRRIMGIRNEPECQAIFIDTPGITQVRSLLDEHMSKTATASAKDADILMPVVDATEPMRLPRMEELGIMSGRPAILVINKADLVAKPSLLPIMQEYAKNPVYTEIVPVSALHDDGMEVVLDLVRKHLPEGPKWFDDGTAGEPTDLAPLIQEVVQEKLFLSMRQEIPYGCAVLMDTVEKTGNLVRAEGVIMVDRDSQKGMVIGEKGSRIKELGTEARLELEKMLGCKVFLGLRVKVEEGWRDREGILVDLGYTSSRIEK
jgi:GTP-binding protein Era